MHVETRRLLKDPTPELVFGLTAAVGADVDGLVDLLDKLLKQFRYKSRTLRLSALLSRVDPNWLGEKLDTSSEFQRIWTHMNAGDALRNKTESGEALAIWSIGDINSARTEGTAGKEPLRLKSRSRESRTSFVRSSIQTRFGYYERSTSLAFISSHSMPPRKHGLSA
jgi:hypothetical protein